MKKIIAILSVIMLPFLLSCGNGKVKSGTHLQVEVVEVPIPGVPGTGGENPEATEEEIDYHDLFSLDPGTWVKMASIGGIVDPVGTTIDQDFDGDGIDNNKETAGNVWVADYPLIETSVSPPITMKIEILNTTTSESVAVSSDITAEDVESTKDLSSEAEHREEVNLRTAQYEDAYKEAVSDSSEIGSSYSSEQTSSEGESSGSSEEGKQLTYNSNGSIASGEITSSSEKSSSGSSSGSSESNSSKVITSHEESYGETKTKWKDVPFKNDTDKDGWALKSNEASKKARKMRSEIREETQNMYEIKPNAGYIKAALYIKNKTVNMPVKIRDILCSFMFQSVDGQLIPVQSFRLRNDDYTIFEIEMYGDTTFGPYVIELKNLNTLEIKEAIAKGYNPKIFIIDYKMNHVEDSNYRDMLSGNFSGDNLKIIEENAKGRTAGVKLVGPGLREFYRVTAFDTDGIESRTGSSGATEVAPGVSLEKALQRISYSGTDIKFANYVIDFSGMLPEMAVSRFLLRTVKSVNGLETRLPLFKDANGDPITTVLGDTVDENGTIIGPQVEACVMKPVNKWTKVETNAMRMWSVFSDGRYFFSLGDKLNENEVHEYFQYTINGETFRIPKVMGIESIIWPGDHYDIVCSDMDEYFEIRDSFGKNPLETGDILNVNTRWRLDELGGEYSYFYVNKKSWYLGEAAPGDVIEFKIKLNNTKYLNPLFGESEQILEDYVLFQHIIDVYSDFSYNLEKTSMKFDLTEAFDFEINFDLGGEHSNWVNLFPERSPFFYYLDDNDQENYGIDVIDQYWDFLTQEFKILIEVPDDCKGISEDGSARIFLRSALNNAYRDSIWPMPCDEVKKFRGNIAETIISGDVIKIENCVGTPDVGDVIFVSDGEETISYTIHPTITPDLNDLIYTITLQSPITKTHYRGERVSIDLTAPLTESEVHLAVDQGFEDEWNSDLGFVSFGNWNTEDDFAAPLMTDGWNNYSPVMNLGFDNQKIIGNWLGNYNYCNPKWNNWLDASFFSEWMGIESDFQLSASTGSMMRILNEIPEVITYPNDFLMSTTNTYNQSRLQLAISGDRAFIVWQSGGGMPDICGRFYDIANGTPINNDFLVSTTNANDQTYPQLAISGDIAFIVWQWGTAGFPDIYGRFYNVTTGTPFDNDFMICTSNTLHQMQPRLAMSGNRALVVWDSRDNGSDLDIRGRLYNIVTGTPIGNDFLISTTNANNQSYSQLAISGDKALIIWHTVDNGSDIDIRGRFYDLANGTLIGNDFLVSTTNTNDQIYPQLATSGDRALVVWESADSGNNPNVRGRLFSIATSTLIGNDFLISSAIAIDSSYPQLAGLIVEV